MTKIKIRKQAKLTRIGFGKRVFSFKKVLAVPLISKRRRNDLDEQETKRYIRFIHFYSIYILLKKIFSNLFYLNF